MANTGSRSAASVAVYKADDFPGNLTFVLLDDREAFDLIDLPMTDHGPKEHVHLLSKHIDGGKQYIVFQYRVKSNESAEAEPE